VPVGRLSLRHALIGGATAALLWESPATFLCGTTHPCRKFRWLRIAYDVDCCAVECRDW
jgi:hypothetical protein